MCVHVLRVWCKYSMCFVHSVCVCVVCIYVHEKYVSQRRTQQILDRNNMFWLSELFSAAVTEDSLSQQLTKTFTAKTSCSCLIISYVCLSSISVFLTGPTLIAMTLYSTWCVCVSCTMRAFIVQMCLSLLWGGHQTKRVTLQMLRWIQVSVTLC